MRKLLIIIACFATLNIAACSRFHLTHKIDVQQGNVVDQEMVNQLEPGMTRSQVQFVMGTPIVVDVFHQERWDYIYFFKPGYGETIEERVSLFFEDDALVRIAGTMQPGVIDPTAEDRKRATVVVPAYAHVGPGIFNRIWHWITFRKPEEP